jgi:hypothetical protein
MTGQLMPLAAEVVVVKPRLPVVVEVQGVVPN